MKQIALELLAIGYLPPQHSYSQEEPMYRKDLAQSGRRASWNGSAGILAIPCIILLVLVGVRTISPSASEWIARAVEAEFTVPSAAPADTPTQLAAPPGETRDGEG